MKNLETLGARVIYALNLRDVKMYELDRILGQGGYLSRLSRDMKSRPDMHIVDKIAAHLRVNFEWLVFGRGPMEPVAYAEVAPVMALDPAWPVEHAKALASRPDLARYIARCGEGVVPDRAVTAELIIGLAELLLLTVTTGPRTPRGDSSPASLETTSQPPKRRISEVRPTPRRS